MELKMSHNGFEIVTMREAYQLADVTRRTIYNWIKEGILESCKVGKFRYIYKASLLAKLTEQK